MKNIKKIFFITIVIVVMLSIIIPTKGYCIDEIISEMDGSSNIETSSNRITEVINTIFSLIRYVGSGLSIIVCMSLGIKYMVSSVEDKADIKKKAIPVVIGCIIIFATTNIIVIISDIVNDFQGSTP